MSIWKNYYFVLSDFKIQHLDCTLPYIPEHLHFKGKPVINIFSIGEKLYYRSKPENLKRPYDNISLRDISHNRNFNNDLYTPNDVLFNTEINDEREVYKDLEVVVLEITELQEKTTFKKEIICNQNSEIKILIILKHDPVPCMYPHSVFEISVNDVVVDNGNYDTILGKKNKTYSDLRSEIRQELTLLIQNRIVDSSLETEYINEP